MTTSRPDAVRLALPGEAAAIAAVQRRSWAAWPDQSVSAALLAGAEVEQMTQAWTDAITRPPDARCRVLVALEGEYVVGMALTSPSPDPDAAAGQDGSIGELTVDPPARHRGHGGRLLNACADTLRADGFGTARIWVATVDDPVRRWLVAAGWAADGAHRQLGTEDDQPRLRQVRLHTDLDESEADGH